TRWIRIDGHERGAFQGGRSREVTGDVTLAVTEARTLIADEALTARQATSAIVLEGGEARLTGQGQLRGSNGRGALGVGPGGKSLTWKVSRLELRCGSAQIILGDDEVAIKAPAIVTNGTAGKVQIDAQGASVAGQEVRCSAVMLNELKG